MGPWGSVPAPGRQTGGGRRRWGRAASAGSAVWARGEGQGKAFRPLGAFAARQGQQKRGCVRDSGSFVLGPARPAPDPLPRAGSFGLPSLGSRRSGSFAASRPTPRPEARAKWEFCPYLRRCDYRKWEMLLAFNQRRTIPRSKRDRRLRDSAVMQKHFEQSPVMHSPFRRGSALATCAVRWLSPSTHARLPRALAERRPRPACAPPPRPARTCLA
jgi:hypothetical protein